MPARTSDALRHVGCAQVRHSNKVSKPSPETKSRIGNGMEAEATATPDSGLVSAFGGRKS